MSTRFGLSAGARIKVVGLGGGGCNAITRMVREQVHGVEFIAMNTDAQHLAMTEAPVRIQIGEKATRGLGAGGNHKIGQKAAEENGQEIQEVLSGADMVFITAGMGGGTGTGAAPVAAAIARRNGALTIGIVTFPFRFEGAQRQRVAEEGVANMLRAVDTLIIIPNDRVLKLCDARTGLDGAFKLADQCLHHGVQAIAEVITVPGLVNLDFADVRAIMQNAGPAWLSLGRGSGPQRAREAARESLSSPLLSVSVDGAKGVLFYIVGSNLTLHEVGQAADVIRQAVDPGANIIFGVALDKSMGQEVKLTIVATGIARQGSAGNAVREAEYEQLLRDIRSSEKELRQPAFVRRPQRPVWH